MTNASDEPPCMSAKVFTSGRIRRAAYDRAARQLDLHWDNKAMLAYQQVPEEVFRRLCNAPNPAAYWEDRIADEYPKARPRKSAADPDRAQKFGDLFDGGG
ncbi:MAG: KTSC domain-containing protein [Burkholderiaceae bacterium]